ncbi:MAG: mechanosensitive ion channel family protein, partial [Deltaproteobacteria bacterium]|nr:mechanosensitive ion channel family protein [Deltaproteobacteria bacterium]
MRSGSLLSAIIVTAISAGVMGQTRGDSANCSTPRKAIETLLYWQQAGHVNLKKASACLDVSRLDDPVHQAPDLAAKLKKTLDGRGLYVELNDLPDQENYKNPADKSEFELFPVALGGIKLQRQGSRWVLAASSLERVPELYSDTFKLGIEDLGDMMPEWLRGDFLGIEFWQVVGVLLLVFLALLLQKVVVYAVGNYVTRIAGRLNVDWIEKIVEKADKPVGGMAMAAVFFVGFPILQFPVRVSQVALFATRVLAAFSVVWLGYRLVDVLADVLAAKAAKTDTKLDDQLVPMVRKSLKVILVVIGGLFILQNLNVDIGSLLAGLGIGGLAFALAAKDTVANLFGSMMIFLDKPFQIGDWVKIGSTAEGTVEEVGFRSTRIRTFYNSVITVPNARLVDTAVDNMGLRRYRRYSTTLGLTYDTPPEKVQAFCEGVRAIIRALPGMRKDYYLVEFKEYGDSALVIMLYCFMDVPDWGAEVRVRTNLNLEIMRLARELGVQFAFPTQTIHVESMPAQQKGGDHTIEDRPDTRRLSEIVSAFGPG